MYFFVHRNLAYRKLMLGYRKNIQVQSYRARSKPHHHITLSSLAFRFFFQWENCYVNIVCRAPTRRYGI